METTKAKKPPFKPTDHSSAVDAIVSQLYLVKSEYCGTVVSDKPVSESEADNIINQLNSEATGLGIGEVTFVKEKVG